jgi:hypothetical protein
MPWCECLIVGSVVEILILHASSLPPSSRMEEEKVLHPDLVSMVMQVVGRTGMDVLDLCFAFSEAMNFLTQVK